MNLGEKLNMRTSVTSEAFKLMGIPYLLGAEWTDWTQPPKNLDCSELVEVVFRKLGLKIPDGSQAQFNFCVPTEIHRPGDLAFAGKDRTPTAINHVGIVYDELQIIEARGFQAGASFKTGEVILRPIEKWLAWDKFVGFRTHPDLV